MRYPAEKHCLTPAFDKKQAAGIAGVALSTIDRWRREGKLPHFKVGGSIRFHPSDVYQVAGKSEQEALEAHIAALVADAPPLSDEQADRIAALLRS